MRYPLHSNLNIIFHVDCHFRTLNDGILHETWKLKKNTHTKYKLTIVPFETNTQKKNKSDSNDYGGGGELKTKEIWEKKAYERITKNALGHQK